MTNMQQEATIIAFDQWLENDQKIKLSDKLAAIIPMMALTETSDAQVSGQNSIATGSLAQQQAEQGKQLDQAIQQGDETEIVNLLTESTGNAVSSILGLAQSRTNWNPLDPNKADNAQGFMNFVEQILKVPYFNTTQSEITTVHYQEENYNSLIDKVVDLYDGITEQDKGKIKDSIVNLAKACTSRVNTQNTKTLFVQNTLKAAERNIVVQLQQTFMMMERSHSTGKGAPKDKYKTEIEVRVLELTFQGNIWTRASAEKLAEKFVKSWDDWLNQTTTPANNNQDSIDFCFGETELA